MELGTKLISVFDTSVESYNIGNEIIMDAVSLVMEELFPNDFLIRLPITDIGKVARRYSRESIHTFVGGTNALNGDLRSYSQWDLNIHNALILKNCILMGCGWFRYEKRLMTRYTQWIYSRVLSKDFIHSVRDEYTKDKCKPLEKKGHKFINTGCPTLWRLSENHLKNIKRQKSSRVVFTITDYNLDTRRDNLICSQILDSYDEVFFFPQGSGDCDYLNKLGVLKKVKLLRPRLSEFDKTLELGADYIGTRLHAGIRALQKCQRSFIIGIDNRSLEMKKDLNLPVINQNDLLNLSDILSDDYELNLNIPWENINYWINQFKKVE